MIALVLALACLALLVACVVLMLQRDFEKGRRVNLERWLRHSLHQIRGECGFMSPAATSVVNSLECALPILGPVNAAALRRDLARIQRERDAHVTEEAQHWCKVRAAADAAARQGAELPLGEAGGGS